MKNNGHTFGIVLGFIILVIGCFSFFSVITKRTLEKKEKDHSTDWNNRGVAAYKGKQYVEAIENFLRALEDNPRDAITWYNLGLAYEQAGQFSEATQAYQKALQLDPARSYASEALQRLYTEQRREQMR